ncbi:MAG TPA: hypothetical protein VKA90_02915 [Beijerinckiaceae bacterium]|nr:hypothetical protein [Beijerinckiaceae bacterium]
MALCLPVPVFLGHRNAAAPDVIAAEIEALAARIGRAQESRAAAP